MARPGKDDDSLVERSEGEAAPNPVWFKPIMIGFMLLGLVWVLVFYLSGDAVPDSRHRRLEPGHRLRHRLHRVPDDDPLAMARTLFESPGPTGAFVYPRVVDRVVNRCELHGCHSSPAVDEPVDNSHLSGVATGGRWRACDDRDPSGRDQQQKVGGTSSSAKSTSDVRSRPAASGAAPIASARR